MKQDPKFPDGKLNETDEGELPLIITKKSGYVLVVFKDPVKWLGLDPEGAVELADGLVKYAIECKKERLEKERMEKQKDDTNPSKL